jgi:hypothetical protein
MKSFIVLVFASLVSLSAHAMSTTNSSVVPVVPEIHTLVSSMRPAPQVNSEVVVKAPKEVAAVSLWAWFFF